MGKLAVVKPPNPAGQSLGAPTQIWRGHARYWFVQVLGWAVLGAVFFAQELIDPTRKSESIGGALLFVLYFAVCGIVCTHLLRAWVHWRRVVVGPWPRLLWNGIPASVVAGVALASAVLSLPLLVPQARAGLWTAQSPGAFAGMALFGAMLCLGWLSFYIGYQSNRAFQEALTEQARYAAALKEAELRALRGQLNPHFLFNALNVVRRLAATDPSRTRQAITQLAGLLRDSLNGGEQPAIKLSAEMRQVEAYLELEKLRFEERLELAWRIAPEAMGRPVPPFSVLTLVENAVKHGIAARIAGGRLEVEAVAEESATVVRVMNSGTLDLDPRTGRVGMTNLRERLKLLYGERSSLELRGGAAGMVIAELRVPAEWPVSPPSAPTSAHTP